MTAGAAQVAVTAMLPNDAAAAIAAFRTPGGFETLAVAWTLLAQDANPGRVALCWAVARRGPEVRAVAAVHIVRRLALGDYVGGLPARITDACRRFGHVPLAFDVAYLEVPLANLDGLMFAPDAGAPERAELARAMFDALDADLPADAICVKETIGRDPGGLDGLRLAPLPFLDRYVLELPGDPPGAAAWLAARSGRRRAKIRRNIRAFEAAGAVLETLDDPAAAAPCLAELFHRTALKARRRGELPLPMEVGRPLFEQFVARIGTGGCVRVVRLKREIVAFLLLLFGHDTLFVRFVGLDYAGSQTCRAYFRLHYDTIEQAAQRGLRFVDMGSGTAHTKLPLGCVGMPTRYRIRFRRRLRRIGTPIAALLDRRFRGVAAPPPAGAEGPGRRGDPDDGV